MSMCILQEILTHWLNKSVDGFYIRNSAYLFTDYDLRDEPKVPSAVGYVCFTVFDLEVNNNIQ